jgi:hypothetical protein
MHSLPVQVPAGCGADRPGRHDRGARTFSGRSFPADSPVAAGKTPVQLRPLLKSYGKEAQLAPSTVKRWSPVVDRLISHLGHDDAAAISRADIVAWKDEWISVHLIAVDAFHNRWSLPVV